MAMFKVRRDLYLAQAACISGSANVGGNLAVTGTVTSTAGITASSSLSVSACATFGSGGTTIAGILSGSTAGCPADIGASAVGAASYAVTGLTTSHKLFITPASMTSGLVLQNVDVAAGSFTANYGNVLSTNTTAACTVVNYLAILDA